MATLVILLATFAFAILVRFVFFHKQSIGYRLCGRTALAAMFLFTGISHFLLDDGMVQMLPEFIPLRYFIIHVTGIIELLFAVGLLIPQYSRLTGILVIAFLICVFPSNIYAALNSVNFGGNVNGPIYLLFRVPLQVFLIGWTWIVAVQQSSKGIA
ncbi:DoxX family protein [Gloeocapsopsis sp. IPPAS B-1203]|uniref:DoxX family protein n=1 Tax=Gloeocapsopsis sp. IPPAS B-1203 TaxID=2049454 RepID=UPI0011813434|nr:DoxX family protein [Gloeocapsopsis sp. IPPAS B-1203]